HAGIDDGRGRAVRMFDHLKPPMFIRSTSTGHTAIVKPCSSMARIRFSSKSLTSSQVRVCAGQSHGTPDAKRGSRIPRTVTASNENVILVHTLQSRREAVVLLEFDADQRLWQE